MFLLEPWILFSENPYGVRELENLKTVCIRDDSVCQRICEEEQLQSGKIVLQSLISRLWINIWRGYEVCACIAKLIHCLPLPVHISLR